MQKMKEKSGRRQSMIRKKPVTGLDSVMEAGFPKRSCSTKMLERNCFDLKRFRSNASRTM
jgi:hypothetical protein